MSATYLVKFDCAGSTEYLYINAADARSMKRADLNAALRNAATRAKAKLLKNRPSVAQPVRVVEVRCVG